MGDEHSSADSKAGFLGFGSGRFGVRSLGHWESGAWQRGAQESGVRGLMEFDGVTKSVEFSF